REKAQEMAEMLMEERELTRMIELDRKANNALQRVKPNAEGRSRRDITDDTLIKIVQLVREKPEYLATAFQKTGLLQSQRSSANSAKLSRILLVSIFRSCFSLRDELLFLSLTKVSIPFACNILL